MQKFAQVENLIEDENKLQRIYENFEHIIAIKEENVQKVLDSCKKYNIECEILDELKYIYENPLINLFKNLKE